MFSFSIWNTTLGTSLLAMAWGIQMAGVIPGTIAVILLGGFCLYTAYCCIQVSRDHGKSVKVLYTELTLGNIFLISICLKLVSNKDAVYF